MCSTLFFDIILLVIYLIQINYFLIYIIVINILAFFIMGYDKYLAKNNKWRISEASLIFISLILGSIGAYLGMYKFRHKTKHIKFTVGIPVIFILNVITIYYLYKYGIIEAGIF